SARSATTTSAMRHPSEPARRGAHHQTARACLPRNGSAAGTPLVVAQLVQVCSALVVRVEQVLVLLGDHLALELHARGDLALLDGEVLVEDGEALDLLPAVQARVELVDVA